VDSVRRENVKRTIRHGMRGESAARCIGPITPGCEIFGITKGDFSMIDILRHVMNEIGPCRIDIGTWTAASADIQIAFDLLKDENIKSMRWIVDRSFPQRQERYFAALLAKFGQDCVRLARFHAKFILLENERFSVAVRTSMNLNLNKRIEFYEISEGTPISGFMRQIVDYHFSMPPEDSYEAFKRFHIDPVESVGEIDAPANASTWDAWEWSGL
jgi:hypothetical protein